MKIFRCDHCGKQESPAEGAETVACWAAVTIGTVLHFDVCEDCSPEFFRFFSRTTKPSPNNPADPPAATKKTARRAAIHHILLAQEAARVQSPPPPASEPTNPSNPARILARIAKRPASSLELIHDLKLEPNQVYQACSNLKKAGKVESVLDESDGTRRYRATEKT